MEKLYERYNDESTGSGTYTVYGNNQVSQSFQCAIINDITSLKFYLIRTGNCTGLTLTMALQEADEVTGEPSGIDLKTVDVSAPTIGTSLEWVEFTLDTPVRSSDKKLCAVLRLDGGDGSNYIGVRYDGSEPLYGGDDYSVIYSDDGAVTWNIDTDKDILFEQWGEEVDLPEGLEQLNLMPGGIGDYTQLHPSKKDYNNYQMVDDAPGAPDDGGSVVYVDFDGRLTGICTWKNQWKGLLGDENTIFLSELAVGYFIRRSVMAIDAEVTNNRFRGNIGEVESIQNDAALTFVDYFYGRPVGQYLDGCWANGHKCTGQMEWQNGKHGQWGIGTLFNTEIGDGTYDPGDRIRNSNIGGKGNYVVYIHNELHLHVGDREGYQGGDSVYTGPTETADIDWAKQGEDLEDNTQYTAPEKKDSYLLKTSRTHGKIYAVKVVYRVIANTPQLVDGEWSPLPVHAKPFLRYGGVDLWGTEVEDTPTVEPVSEGNNIHQCSSEWKEYEEFLTSCPAGGPWTWEKVNELQVGIQLDMDVLYDSPNSYISRMECTQVYVVIYHDPPESPPPEPEPDPEPPIPPEPPEPPEPIICTEGDTKCLGFDLMTCVNNQWKLTEHNSEACGYVVPPQPKPDVFYKGITESGKAVHNGLDEYGRMCEDDMSEGGYVIREHF